MKATITTNWGTADSSDTPREFQNFDEFKSYDFTPNKSISLFTGDPKDRYLHLHAFPNRNMENTSVFEYTVTLISHIAEKDIKLIPAGADPQTIERGDNVYVTKDLMLNAVEHFFKENGALNPQLRWHVYNPVYLTDAERDEMDRSIKEMTEKHGDIFSGEPVKE